MSEKGIAHRDLKPENILLKGGQVKICDLGASKVLDRSDKKMNTPYVVSRYYRAPELILGSNLYDCSIDIWAAGCITYELLTLTPLFPGDTEGFQLLEHTQILGQPSPKEHADLSKICDAGTMNLLERCGEAGLVDLERLVADKRPGDEVREVADLIVRCLKWVPSDRISA